VTKLALVLASHHRSGFSQFCFRYFSQTSSTHSARSLDLPMLRQFTKNKSLGEKETREIKRAPPTVKHTEVARLTR